MNSFVYLDCNATTPVEERVRATVLEFLGPKFGNAGSRTHETGAAAKRAVQAARDQVAAVVGAKRDETLFTSGATESNNLAILGLAAEGVRTGRRHIVSSAIEHKAVLEPLERLEAQGFEVTLVRPESGGWISPKSIRDATRDDTLLISVMHVNNETGVLQPVDEIADGLDGCSAYFHVDAAQGFGKYIEPLRHPRIDLISASSHKVYGPQGVGALISRRRGYDRAPLTPLAVGGGQERGLRPGTLPLALIAGFGVASELALETAVDREALNRGFRERALKALAPLGITVHSDERRTAAHVLNFSIPGVDSEAVILCLKDLVALSNGSACTSQSYEPSHVLEAMELPQEQIAGAIRMSWCHLTPEPDWSEIVGRLRALQ